MKHLENLEIFQAENESRYISNQGRILQREYETLTPHGNTMDGKWVLRDASENLIDFDKYLNDLIEHNSIRVEYYRPITRGASLR